MNDFPDNVKVKLENYDFVENPKKLKRMVFMFDISVKINP